MENTKNILGQFISDIWWILLLRGIMLFLFGFLLMLYPGITLITVMAILGAYWFIDGMFMIITSVVGHKNIDGWGWGIFSGILGILAGIAIMLHPVAGAIFTQVFLVYFLSFTAIFKGVSDVYFGIKLRKEINNEWAYILGGIISILLGVFILMNPLLGSVMLVWLVIVFAIAGGILLIIRSFQLNKISKKLKEEA